MIICVSANPAVDRRIRVPSLRLGEVNRAASASSALGGKAAHVAMVASALGTQALWVGFLGGATGEECRRGLAALGIPAEVVHTKSTTRMNLEIIEADGAVTELLEPGGEVTAEEVAEIFRVCERLFEKYGAEARVVLSGSLPPGADRTFYAQLIESAHNWGCHVSLDTSGEALAAGLKASPDLIKPNRDEAESALGQKVRDTASAYEAARAFIDRGARAVALSLGADGLLWLSSSAQAEPLWVRPPVVEGISTVGCGDATLAGFAVAALRHESESERAVLGVACGAANCLADSPGMIDASEVLRLAPLVEVRKLSLTQGQDKTGIGLRP